MYYFLPSCIICYLIIAYYITYSMYIHIITHVHICLDSDTQHENSGFSWPVVDTSGFRTKGVVKTMRTSHTHAKGHNYASMYECGTTQIAPAPPIPPPPRITSHCQISSPALHSKASPQNKQTNRLRAKCALVHLQLALVTPVLPDVGIETNPKQTET